MVKSMTAYGRGEYELYDTIYITEIKSLNNRYRDVILRLPRNLQVLEDEIRTQISARVRRGRIEASVQIESRGEEAGYGLELNLPLVKAYLRIFKQLGNEFGFDKKISAEKLCQMKDIIIMKPEEMDVDRSRSGIIEAMGRALDSLDGMRSQEGRAIEKDFLMRLNIIEKHLGRIEKRSPIVLEEFEKKLREKIDSMTQDFEVDESRLAQEVVYISGRSDITEEIVRTRSHLDQFRTYLSTDDSIGRRLDFLIQEINREVNTIASKTSDSSISFSTVEMKAELEKLREQVQNVE